MASAAQPPDSTDNVRSPGRASERNAISTAGRLWTHSDALKFYEYTSCAIQIILNGEISSNDFPPGVSYHWVFTQKTMNGGIN